MSWTIRRDHPLAGRYRCDSCHVGFPRPTQHLCRGRRCVAPWVAAAVARRAATPNTDQETP